jgi:electron transport complex protein RnfG
MTEVSTQHNVAPVSSLKMFRAMVGIGLICALLIVLTFEGTFTRIENNKAEALEKAVFKVLPGITKKKAFQLDPSSGFIIAEEGINSDQIIYAGYDQDDNLKGLAVEASGIGFADVIRILYGYDPQKQVVVGFYVLESKETPGLGDKIEKDLSFLENFKALDVALNESLAAINNKVVPVKKGKKENPWEVDGITGATISSRAIGNIIGNSTEKWVPLIFENKELFELIKEEN